MLRKIVLVVLLSLSLFVDGFTRPRLLPSTTCLLLAPLKSAVSAAGPAPADPRLADKVDRLDAASVFIEQLSNRLVDLVDEDEPEKSLQHALEICLFADKNGESEERSSHKAGQSVREKRASFYDGLASKRGQIIAGEAGSSALNAVVEALLGGRGGEQSDVGIIVGDCGLSLIGDLLLAHVLVALQLASRVTLIASDPAQASRSPSPSLGASTLDAAGHIEHLADPRLHGDVWAVRHFGEALRMHVTSGQIVFAEGDDAMPPRVEGGLAGFKMVFVKGDENYRRLLGEREWPLDTPARDVLSHWPVPVCALRCVQSEVGCGISEAVQSRLEREDVSWMLRGRHYQVQQYIPQV